ncbi:MAG: LysR family transcriptional regulator, partial [Actinobacteria bacterium]|nr:LysR family transcriptional regulator [Actinomycetota bacterium]
MQLNQLGYFVALAETLHFTHAAERAGVAQPTLSQQIRVLEDELGAHLVTRRPRNIELTAAGEELLPIARRILAEADNARRALVELADLQRGRVRLGATPSLCTSLLPEVVADYRRAHPGVAIVITEGGSHDLQRQLVAGELDLAVLIDPRTGTHEGLSTTPLFVEELVLISALDAVPPTRRSRIAIAGLRTAQLVMFRDGYDLRETTIAACRDAGFEPTLAVEGGEMD